MAKGYPVGFRIMIPEPVEVKMVSPTVKDRDNISALERYAGLFTYVVEEDVFYYLSKGKTNKHWKPIGKPQAVIILDEFNDGEQTIISGAGLKRYLEANYITREEITGLLAGSQIPDHIAAITPQEVEKLKTIKGDISEVVHFPTSEITWVVPHPEGKSLQTFNLLGQRVFGRETKINPTLTAVGFSKPLAGYASIN